MNKILQSLILGGAVAFAQPVLAQYDAGATHMLGQGMGFSNLSSSTYRNSIEATKGNSGERSRVKREDRSKSTSSGSSRSNTSGPKSTGTSNAKSADPVLRSQADVDRFMNERMAYHARALAPEYKRRAARDGQASADKWIRARGEELGKMEGERARKFVKRD